MRTHSYKPSMVANAVNYIGRLQQLQSANNHFLLQMYSNELRSTNFQQTGIYSIGIGKKSPIVKEFKYQESTASRTLP